VSQPTHRAARALAATVALLGTAAGSATEVPEGPPPQGPAPPRLYVVAIQAPGSLTFTGKSLGDAVAREASRLGGFEVLGPDEVAARIGTRAYLRLVDCAGDAPCLATSGAPFGADRIVGGRLVQRGSLYQLEIALVDVVAARALATFTGEIPVAARRLQSDVSAASAALLRGESVGQGAILASANVPKAELRVDGELVGLTPMTRPARPGRHRVQVSKPGYEPTEPRWVDVAPGQSVTVTFDLVPLSMGTAPSRP
jgi:hypothetical protein